MEFKKNTVGNYNDVNTKSIKDALLLIISSDDDPYIKDTVMGYILGEIDDYIKEKGLANFISDYCEKTYGYRILKLEEDLVLLRSELDLLKETLGIGFNNCSVKSIIPRLEDLEEKIAELKSMLYEWNG